MRIELKAKEQKLLQLICDDYSNTEIAEKFDCGLRHAEKMKSRLYQKTGTRSNISLLKWAVLNKLYTIKKSPVRKTRRSTVQKPVKAKSAKRAPR
jgi:DNA-binding CsgD family transcriptional regulator